MRVSVSMVMARHRGVDPVDARPDLAQRVQKHQPLCPRAVQDRARRVEPADGEAHENGACGRQFGQHPLQIGGDDAIGQFQPGIEGRAGLSPKIPAQRAEALVAQHGGDGGLPGVGRAGERVDEDEGGRARAGRCVVDVEERIGFGQGQVHGAVSAADSPEG